MRKKAQKKNKTQKRKKNEIPNVEMTIIDEKGKSHKATKGERRVYFKKIEEERD